MKQTLNHGAGFQIQADLLRTLSHALEEIEKCERFARTAEIDGDIEVSRFFSELAAEDRRRVDQAKGLLWERLNLDLQNALGFSLTDLP